MEENIKNFSEQLIPWMFSHGLKIIIIITGTWVLQKVLSRIIRRAVMIAVVSDGTISKEAEKKREDTLIRIFNGALAVIILTIAILMILQEIGLEIGPILAGAGIIGLAVGFGGQYLIRDII